MVRVTSARGRRKKRAWFHLQVHCLQKLRQENIKCAYGRSDAASAAGCYCVDAARVRRVREGPGQACYDFHNQSSQHIVGSPASDSSGIRTRNPEVVKRMRYQHRLKYSRKHVESKHAVSIRMGGHVHDTVNQCGAPATDGRQLPLAHVRSLHMMFFAEIDGAPRYP